jgi:predicted permease
MLLAGAGLFLRSFLNLLHVDTGFNKHNVLILSVDPNAAGYQVGARLETMMEQVEGRVAALRGVRSASFAFSIFGGGWTGPATVPGRANSGRDPDVFNNITGPNFLSVMQMPLVAGRIFDSHDTLAGQRVAVINQAMARTYFPGVSPLGKTFSVGPEPEWRDIEVVGVVRDAKYMSLTERGRPAAFYPHAQHGMFLYNFMVRYSGDADSVIPQVRKTIQSIDRNLPVSTASSLRDLIDDSTSKQRLIAQLSSAFGVLAAVLASIGIYGVISYGVKQKTNEFGLRMALGATKQDVLWAVFRDVLRLTLLGMFVGIPLPLALSFSSMMRSQLYGLKSYDPVSIACAAVALFILAGLAGYLPARRATEIDPMIALRYE